MLHLHRIARIRRKTGAVAAQMKRAKRLMNSGKYCIKRRLKFIAWMATQPTTTTTTPITTTTATIVCGGLYMEMEW